VANKFDVLIDTILANFTEVQSVTQDLLKLKDELLTHYLPPSLLFRIAVVFGKVYRSFSDLNTPVNEILRLVKINSSSWEKNNQVLKRLHDMHENKKQMLNIAIRRLALVEKKTKLFDRERRILNWEKLFIRLSEAKGHGRRWKFQMETFRKKANEGYDDLIRWVMRDGENNQQEQEEGELEGDQDASENNTDLRARKANLRKEKKGKEKGGLEDGSSLSLDMKSSFSDDLKKNNDEVTKTKKLKVVLIKIEKNHFNLKE
jgi:hypothetical protein